MAEYLRDGRAHDLSVLYECEDLYVLEGRTQEQVSQMVTVPLSTVKRWSVERDWESKRREYRRIQSEVRFDEAKGRERLIKDVIETGNPMAAFAFSALESARARAREMALKEREALAQTIQVRPIGSKDEAAAALQEAIEIKLARMLADPGQVSLKAIQELSKALEFVQGLKAEAATGQAAKDAGLSDDAKREIRALLGVES